MRALKVSFLYYCLCLIAGILSYTYIPLLWGVILLVFLLFLLFVFSRKHFYLFNSKPGVFYLYILLFSVVFYLAGCLSMHIYEIKRNTNNFSLMVEQEKADLFEIVIDEVLKTPYENRQKYLGNVKRVGEQLSQGKVMVHLTSFDDVTLTAGDIILCKSRFVAFNPPRNPGQFDYKKYMYVQGVEGQIYIRDFESIGTEKSARYGILRFRKLLLDKLTASKLLSQDSSSLLAALLLGDRTYIEDEVITSFKDIGVMHVLAISGLHIGIIYMFLAFVFRFVPPVFQTVIIVLLLWLFVFLSGFSPSVFRAVLMFSIVALSRGMKRSGNLLNTIGLALFFSLFFCPVWIYDVGFQLSYCAVIGIVLGMPLFINKYSKNRLIRYIQGLVYVSLVAQLSVLPLQIYYFHQFSLHFLLANLVVIPLITVLIVTGISFLLFTYIFSPVAGIISFVVNFFTGLLFVWVQSLKQWDFLIINDINLNVRQAFLVAFLLIGLGSYLYKKERWKLMIILCLLIVFQGDIFYTNRRIGKINEMVIPYFYREGTVIMQKTKNTLWVHTQDSAMSNSGFLKDYQRDYRIKSMQYDTLRYFYNGIENAVLLVLTEKYNQYKIGECATMVLISGDVKVNYSRLLEYHSPEKVIIHNSTPKWAKDKIIENCIHQNIPFYDMGEKGYFKWND